MTDTTSAMREQIKKIDEVGLRGPINGMGEPDMRGSYYRLAVTFEDDEFVRGRLTKPQLEELRDQINHFLNTAALTAPAKADIHATADDVGEALLKRWKECREASVSAGSNAMECMAAGGRAGGILDAINIIKAHSPTPATDDAPSCARQIEYGEIVLPVHVQQRLWEFCYDIASHAQSLPEPMSRVFFQRAKDIAILVEGVSSSDMPRGLQSAFKWKCDRVAHSPTPPRVDEKWRSMDTVPKDGTPVILYVPWQLSIGKITVAAFIDNEWHITQRTQGGQRIKGGVTIPVPATAWMPLPPSPLAAP